MTQEDYVSFETAKLLKEKGFDQISDWGYREDGTCVEMIDYPTIPPTYWGVTLQMAMKWLREVHNLHCDIGYDDLDWSWNVISVSKDVPIGDRPRLIMNGYACNKTYEKACEAAIKYCLENLI